MTLCRNGALVAIITIQQWEAPAAPFYKPEAETTGTQLRWALFIKAGGSKPSKGRLSFIHVLTLSFSFSNAMLFTFTFALPTPIRLNLVVGGWALWWHLPFLWRCFVLDHTLYTHHLSHWLLPQAVLSSPLPPFFWLAFERYCHSDCLASANLERKAWQWGDLIWWYLGGSARLCFGLCTCHYEPTQPVISCVFLLCVNLPALAGTLHRHAFWSSHY